MNTNVKLLLATMSAFIIGLSVNNIAMSDITSKIAVVDIQEIVNTSAQVMELKKEQEAIAKDFIAFIEKARKDVAATTDTKKKQALEEKYTKELNNKKEIAEKKYQEKLVAINDSISNQIEAQAKINNYDIVIEKHVVLYGGNDITDSIKKALKAKK